MTRLTIAIIVLHYTIIATEKKKEKELKNFDNLKRIACPPAERERALALPTQP